MERTEIMETSESKWASPLVIVTKKDGGVWLCVDYSKLNQVTKYDPYTMPPVKSYWRRLEMVNLSQH